MSAANGRSAGTVVVTGASTGIGRATALRLAAAGYHVFATVRREEDAESLKAAASGRLTTLLMDVTDSEAIQAAFAEVQGAVGDAGIAGLVNNAGIGVSYPAELIPLDLLRRSYDINLFGQVEMIQTFLPLLRSAGGRIINIGSIGDRLTIPFGAPLNSAKWAFASVTEALRLELRPWGIHVVLIEPASIKTDAIDKLESDAKRVLSELDELGRARYGDTYRSMIERALKIEAHGSPPDVVAQVILEALTAKKPKSRYLAGKHGRRLALLSRLPDPVFDRIRIKLFGLPPEFGGLRAQDEQLTRAAKREPTTI
jgi:NAD(P)-dependent dehydrogenase (short-subunit alcohol dehydrogenase family)